MFFFENASTLLITFQSLILFYLVYQSLDCFNDENPK